MPFDINNGFHGDLFGRDRVGHTTPDAEASESLRPWLPVPYPAPYLPARRQDQGHPVLANVVFSSQNLIGQDASGAFVPAGLFCGQTATNANHATGGGYCILKYSSYDVGFAYNAMNGNYVATAGEIAVLVAPSNGVDGDVYTFADGSTYVISETTNHDITNAHACTLFPAGSVKPIGVALRNVFQYIGGVTISTTTGGMHYWLNGIIPTKFKVMNYMHEMGTAVQTKYVLRLPWIGANLTALQTMANADGVVGYTQGFYSRSFVHFTAPVVTTPGVVDGCLAYGNMVVAGIGEDAGNYAAYNATSGDPITGNANTLRDVCGRIIGIQNMYPIRDYANRVRTLWDPNRLVGPIQDPNPASIMMGGSATAGIDYQLNLGTDAAFQKAYTQGRPLHPEYSTYVLVHISL